MLQWRKLAESIHFSSFMISEHLCQPVLCIGYAELVHALLCVYLYTLYFICTQLIVL